MKKVNNKSIFSLLLGSISILMPFIGYMFIGLIFAIMGVVMSYKSIKEIRGSSETGIVLAIAGMVISITGICYKLFIIFILVIFSIQTSFR